MENADLKTQKILVIEDNSDILEMLRDWLPSIGYEVAGYTATDDIIKLTEETQPQLVILDYLLSDVNGGEYCHQLKHHPRTCHLPVIMLSAHQRVIDSLGHYGWDAFVSKPFDLDQLATQISTLVDNNRE